MKRFILAAALAAGASASAADPVLDRVASVVVQGRRIDITVEATLDAPGVITVAGTINSAAVQLTRKAKAGHRTYKLKLDAKKYVKSLTTSLQFDLVLAARDTASGAEATQPVTATVPVPCIVLPGFGNETAPDHAGGLSVFAAALNTAAGGGYTTTGAHPTLVVKGYPSRTASLAALGKSVGPVVRRALKGTLFSKVDLVGYSYGGIVARSYMSQGGGPFVRHCVFAASPNLGCTVAYLGVAATKSPTISSALAGNAQVQAALAQFVDPQSQAALRNLFPTYSWALWKNPLTQHVEPAPSFLLTAVFVADPATPLTALNAVPPAAGVTFDAFFYTSTGAGQLGTVDVLNISDVQSALANPSSFDPTSLANGVGDGVAPAHSVTMDEVPAWAGVITKHDAGVGTHVTMTTDPIVIAGIATVLTQ
jgi:pimeloyl-ACP methyl ester carboxylesterase